MIEIEALSTELPFVYGGPKVAGEIRQNIDDFFVDEDLGFEPDGEGHHVLLHIEKRDTNTQWLVKQVARYAELPAMEVGYAGLKDRHAVTRQWISVHLAGRDLDWQGFNSDQWQILEIARHQRKLRPGFLRGNKFRIVVRNLQGDVDGLDARLSQIKQRGMANYFGEQRFGFDNIARAYAWLSGELKVKKKQEKSILLSSLRSAIFNQILAERISVDSWDQAILGDVMMLSGSHSIFASDELDDALRQRLQVRDISTTGLLFGAGDNKTHSAALELEADVLSRFPKLCERLKKTDLKSQRRALIVMPEDLQWSIDKHRATLTLQFGLNSGSYATSLLREIVSYQVAKDD